MRERGGGSTFCSFKSELYALYGDDVYDFSFSGSSGVDGVHSFHYKCYVLNNFILFFFYCVRRSSVSVDDGV